MPGLSRKICTRLLTGFAGATAYASIQLWWGAASYQTGNAIAPNNNDRAFIDAVVGNALGGCAVGAVAAMICLTHTHENRFSFNANEFARPLLPVVASFLPFAATVAGDALGGLLGLNCKEYEPDNRQDYEEKMLQCLRPDPFLSDNAKTVLLGETILTAGVLFLFGSYLLITRPRALGEAVGEDHNAYQALEEVVIEPAREGLPHNEDVALPEVEGEPNQPGAADDLSARNLVLRGLFRSNPVVASPVSMERQQVGSEEKHSAPAPQEAVQKHRRSNSAP
jgi:hypothetical protein